MLPKKRGKMKTKLTSEMRTKLIELAVAARERAYAPYSHYMVGAALLTSGGKYYTGANVENAAYPSGLCAERVALFYAVSQGEREFVAVAVVTSNGGTPCGSCRQALAEFGLDTLVIIADSRGKVMQEVRLAELLPGAFGPGDLGR
jgi:cytidine deaminase